MSCSKEKDLYIKNKQALFNYEIIEEFEAGIVLFGAEVKSIRAGQANLKGSYITIHTGTPVLVGCHISEYSKNTEKKLAPTRERRILLHKKEIVSFLQKIKESGSTIVPIAIYTKGNLIKLRCALVRGRKKWQKKQVLKERDLAREIQKNTF